MEDENVFMAIANLAESQIRLNDLLSVQSTLITGMLATLADSDEILPMLVENLRASVEGAHIAELHSKLSEAELAKRAHLLALHLGPKLQSVVLDESK